MLVSKLMILQPPGARLILPFLAGIVMFLVDQIVADPKKGQGQAVAAAK